MTINQEPQVASLVNGLQRNRTRGDRSVFILRCQHRNLHTTQPALQFFHGFNSICHVTLLLPRYERE